MVIPKPIHKQNSAIYFFPPIESIHPLQVKDHLKNSPLELLIITPTKILFFFEKKENTLNSWVFSQLPRLQLNESTKTPWWLPQCHWEHLRTSSWRLGPSSLTVRLIFRSGPFSWKKPTKPGKKTRKYPSGNYHGSQKWKFGRWFSFSIGWC